MKKRSTLLVLAATRAGGTAWAHGDGVARHGGLVQMAGEIKFDLVAKADAVEPNLDDHGVCVPTAKLSGKISVLSGGNKLKVSHYINLCRFENERFGQDMIVRGSLERLTPVLMTALVAAFALTPLLFAGDTPGKEILHPVAVVIFGGLISSTLLDTLLTPVVFWLVGERATQRLIDDQQAAEAEARPLLTREAF